MDRRKIVIICLIPAAVFLYLVAANLTEALFSVFDWPMGSYGIGDFFSVSISDLVGIFLAAVAYTAALRYKTLMHFFEECVTELAKVVYPTPKDSGQAGVAVVWMVGLAMVFLAIVDFVWSMLTHLVL